MKIDRIETFLMHAAPPGEGGWAARNWLFVKVYTDEGLTGVGEASGWPRVVQTAIQDLTPLLIGEDPQPIEKLWHKMFSSIMGHGMTGIVGGGGLTGVQDLTAGLEQLVISTTKKLLTVAANLGRVKRLERSNASAKICRLVVQTTFKRRSNDVQTFRALSNGAKRGKNKAPAPTRSCCPKPAAS